MAKAHIKRMNKTDLERVGVEERAELYYAAHPGSPSAEYRPRIGKQGIVWIALLGPSIEKGVVGIGSTVEMALRAFDVQYLTRLRSAA